MIKFLRDFSGWIYAIFKATGTVSRTFVAAGTRLLPRMTALLRIIARTQPVLATVAVFPFVLHGWFEQLVGDLNLPVRISNRTTVLTLLSGRRAGRVFNFQVW